MRPIDLGWLVPAQFLLDDVIDVLDFTDPVEKEQSECWFVRATEDYVQRQGRHTVEPEDVRTVVRRAIAASESGTSDILNAG